MHGQLDTVAPAKNTVELAEALRHLGVSVTTSYLMEGHSQLVIALMSARRQHYNDVHRFVLEAIQLATQGLSLQVVNE
jgi:predicted esterase